MCELGHNDTYHLHWLLMRIAQRLGEVVGVEVVRVGIVAYHLAFLLAYAVAAVESARHGGYRHAEMLGYILHRSWL